MSRPCGRRRRDVDKQARWYNSAMKSLGQHEQPPFVVWILSALAALVPFVSALAFPVFATSASFPRADANKLNASPRSQRIVTSTNDSGPGSLRQAISDAASDDLISFAPNVTGTITLTSGQLVISTSLTLDGPGAGTLTVSGNFKSRVFNVLTGISVTLSGVSIGGGSISDYPTNGGGIKNSGTLTLTKVLVAGNGVSSSFGPSGGGIYNEGTLTVIESSVSGNLAYGPCGGGGPVCGNGAGIANTAGGVATIVSTTLSDNLYGGGIYNEGRLDLINSVVRGGTGGIGGIYNSGALSILNSSVTGNDGYGYHSGGIGGILNVGTMTVTNSTVSGNTTTGQMGFVAGILNLGRLTAHNVTVGGNSSNGPSGGWPAGIANHNFSGPANSNVLTLSAAIVANNLVSGTVYNCDGPVVSSGHNLSDDASCSFTAAGDISNTDARLAPLGYYGGPTLTQIPLPNSPAIDAGDNATCPPFDQRGISRPIDGNRDGNADCDIGAVEFNLTKTLALPTMFR